MAGPMNFARLDRPLFDVPDPFDPNEPQWEIPQMSVADRLEPHRAALFGHCYRMLASTADADDAVQETMLRAWTKFEQFDGRSELRTWLYRIATNVCFDQLRGRSRRVLPVLESAVGDVGDSLETRPRVHWLEPVPDARALPQEASPDHAAELRQSLRLAFVAALQTLPARQRAVLLLKDVLGFGAAEIAETLETTVAAVNSALQRARQTLADRRVEAEATPSASLTPTQRDIVERFAQAFERYDVETLVTLLREDVTMSMPPFTLWLQGRMSVQEWLLGRGAGCRGSRLVPVAASGSVAFGQYRPSPTGYTPWSLLVIELGEDAVETMTYFLDVETLFAHFGLPPKLEADAEPIPMEAR